MSESKKISKRSIVDVESFEEKEGEESQMAAVPKTLTKRRRDATKEAPSAEKKLEWLKEQAKSAKIPKEEATILKPEYLFAEEGPLIVHLCRECKQFNAQRQVVALGGGMSQLPLGMCNVCRHHLNRQRTVLFFEHKLPTVKKSFNL